MYSVPYFGKAIDSSSYTSVAPKLMRISSIDPMSLELQNFLFKGFLPRLVRKKQLQYCKVYNYPAICLSMSYKS